MGAHQVGLMLTSAGDAEMRSDPPLARPFEDELTRAFAKLTRKLLGHEVEGAEARVAVAGKSCDLRHRWVRLGGAQVSLRREVSGARKRACGPPDPGECPPELRSGQE